MSKRNDEETALKRAMPPLDDRELKRDLWPEMLRRLEERPIRVPWFDWALVALLAALAFIFPGVIPAVLYHL